MDYTERKWRDRIAEGICKYKHKKTGNPYAILEMELDHNSEYEMAEEIYNFLLKMGMIK